jgi:hypothetical protein
METRRNELSSIGFGRRGKIWSGRAVLAWNGSGGVADEGRLMAVERVDRSGGCQRRVA